MLICPYQTPIVWFNSLRTYYFKSKHPPGMILQSALAVASCGRFCSRFSSEQAFCKPPVTVAVATVPHEEVEGIATHRLLAIRAITIMAVIVTHLLLGTQVITITAAIATQHRLDIQGLQPINISRNIQRNIHLLTVPPTSSTVNKEAINLTVHHLIPIINKLQFIIITTTTTLLLQSITEQRNTLYTTDLHRLTFMNTEIPEANLIPC